MLNKCGEGQYKSIYACIEKRCLDCRSRRPCPPLIVIAMGYESRIAKLSDPKNEYDQLACYPTRDHVA
jgi:hypothetical protein